MVFLVGGVFGLMKAPNKYDVLSRERRHDGFYKVDCLTVRHQCFSGNMSEVISREIVRRGEIVVVVPYDPIRDLVILTKQWRTGALAAQELPNCPDAIMPWVVETVAGYINPGETPLVAASRELQEETDFEPKHLELIGQVLTNPGLSDEIAHLFYAEIDVDKTGHISGVENEGEDILVTAVPAQDVFDSMDKWEIQKATSLVALNWLRMNRPKLMSA